MSRTERYKSDALTLLTASIPLAGSVFYSVDTALTAVEHRTRFSGPRSRYVREASNRYVSHFHRLDPLHPRRFSRSAASVVALHDAVELSEFARSEYYCEFFAPLGLRYAVELFLRDRGAIIGGIAVLRGSEGHDFTASELNFLRRAQPLFECGFAACCRADEDATPPMALADELSSREREIVELVSTGASNHEIACELQLSISTVKTHLYNVFRKVGVRSRTQLIAALRDPARG